MKTIKSVFDEHILQCCECGSERQKVLPSVIPEDFKKAVIYAAKTTGMRVDYYLYCKKCKNY